MPDPDPPLSCPSAQPGMVDAHIFGIVAGTPEEPRLAYLKRGAEVGPELLAELGDIEPTRIFRYSAKCENARCGQYEAGQEGGRCGLARRIADMLPPVVDALPSCQIRPSCRWHREIGPAACLRCPQVMTLVPADQPQLRAAALGETG